MSFLRRSPRAQATPGERVSASVQPQDQSFMSRLLTGRHSPRTSRGIGKPTRQDPVVPRKSRGNLFGRSRRTAPATNPVAAAVAPIKEAIAPHNQGHQVSTEDKVHGFGSRIAGRLTGRPRQEAAGAEG